MRILLLPDINYWVMSFDFGVTRIGGAIANTALRIPHPLGIIAGRNKFEKLDKIANLVAEWRPRHLVVGMPGDGVVKEKLHLEVVRFANRLTHRFKLPHSFINEEYSSHIAGNQLQQQQVMGIK